MEQQRKVVTIPPTVSRFTAAPIAEQKKRRVAAYARVSTDSDEQFTSYEAQIDYYTQYIKARDDWEFVKVYTDEEPPYPVLLEVGLGRSFLLCNCNSQTNWVFVNVNEVFSAPAMIVRETHVQKEARKPQ